MRATTLLETALQSEVFSQNYAAPKSRECLLARFRDSHARILGEKRYLDVSPVERSRIYYKGEGGGFPQVRAVLSLVCPCCPWLVLTLKVLQLCTNHFVWVVCRPVWVNKLVNLPSPIPELQHSPLPFKVLWAKERVPTLPSSAVFHLDSHLNPSRSWECVTCCLCVSSHFNNYKGSILKRQFNKLVIPINRSIHWH